MNPTDSLSAVPLSTQWSNGSQPISQSTQSVSPSTESAFARSMAAAQTGATDPANNHAKPTHTLQELFMLSVHRKIVSKAMADVAEARNEASKSIEEA
jgi:hypothetical protein